MPRLITLTGERRDNKYFATINGKDVGLSRAQFRLLTRLCVRRLTTKTGYAYGRYVSRSSVNKLRNAIDEAFGDDAGMELIERGGIREYRLADGTEIKVDVSFLELPPNVIEDADAEALRRHFGHTEVT